MVVCSRVQIQNGSENRQKKEEIPKLNEGSVMSLIHFQSLVVDDRNQSWKVASSRQPKLPVRQSKQHMLLYSPKLSCSIPDSHRTN